MSKIERSNYGLESARAKAAVIFSAGLLAVLAAGDKSVSKASEMAHPKWPGRVHLANNTYGSWSPRHPEPPLEQHPDLLIVDDGRYNYPNHGPNPDADTPTGLYADPDQHSRAVEAVPDGTILKATAWTKDGQKIEDAHGYASTVWEEVEAAPGWPQAWVPGANTGFTDPAILRKILGKPKP